MGQIFCLAVNTTGVESFGGKDSNDGEWEAGTEVRKIEEDRTVDGLVTRFEVLSKERGIWIPARTYGPIFTYDPGMHVDFARACGAIAGHRDTETAWHEEGRIERPGDRTRDVSRIANGVPPRHAGVFNDAYEQAAEQEIKSLAKSVSGKA